MNIYTITVAYCPAVLLSRSLILYQKYRQYAPDRHIVVQGHYPINEKKNTNDIALVVEALNERLGLQNIELWDPGKNLGSAQSQNWVLARLNLENDDYFINLDPDSACKQDGWDWRMKGVLDADPNCVLVSCDAPMVQRYMALKGEQKIFSAYDIYGRPLTFRTESPMPFNLSMWRASFIKEIGGIPQGGLWWGETEGPFHGACRAKGKTHQYLVDYIENEDGKFMQDRQHNEYKDFHMRVGPEQQFLGSYDEYLRWKYPQLAEIDTCKDLNNHNHP